MGSLRVIAGERRGYRLASPSGLRLRPTSGLVKKALFDILAGQIERARFVDLFAGTGAVGIEALSRGASWCVFVEGNRAAARTIRRNLATCGYEDLGLVICGRLPAALSRIPRGAPNDLVFLDPPYDAGEVGRTLLALDGPGLLAPAARVIVEHRRSWVPPATSGSLAIRRSVRHGDTVLSFFGSTDGQSGAVGRGH